MLDSYSGFYFDLIFFQTQWLSFFAEFSEGTFKKMVSISLTTPWDHRLCLQLPATESLSLHTCGQIFNEASGN